jgi:ElaA protein
MGNISKRKPMKISWTCSAFDALSNSQLYDILALRTAIFIVEQNCPFQDQDGKKDFEAYHLQGRNENGELLGYARLLPSGLAYEQSSIGRVATSTIGRGHGVGKQLMAESIQKIYEIYGKQSIKIGAQYYLKTFYESFGFNQTSEIYLEDGIEHIEMLRN